MGRRMQGERRAVMHQGWRWSGRGGPSQETVGDEAMVEGQEALLAIAQRARAREI